jgi:dynein heavy chain
VLRKTEASVKVMQDELEAKVPLQEQAQADANNLMKTVERDEMVATEKKLHLQKENAVIEMQEKEAKALSDDGEAQLNMKKPTLLSAQEMIAKLDKKMIDEMKQMRNPPSGMKLLIEAIYIMKSVRDDRQ